MNPIDELAKVRFSLLTYLLFEINSCIDECGSESVSIEQVKSHVAAGDIWQFLAARFDGHMDLSLFDGNDVNIVVRNLQDILEALGTQSRRKFGVEKSGLCLLIAWITELMQRHPRFPRITSD